jgi:hypothetical protein
MELEYDIFELLPDGAVIWRGFGRGLDQATNKLRDLSRRSSNELFVFHAPTKQIVIRTNVASNAGWDPPPGAAEESA